MSQIIKLGCASEYEHSQAGTVIDVGGISFTLCACTHGYAMGYILEIEEIGTMEQLSCTVKKTSPDGTEFGAEYTRLEEIGGGYSPYSNNERTEHIPGKLQPCDRGDTDA